MKYTKSLLFLALLISLGSCKKAIELTPTHVATLENAIKSIDDIETALSSMYGATRGVGYYGRNYSVLPDMMADDMVETGESLANFREITDWAYSTANATIAETWIGCYGIIREANIIINNVDKFATPTNAKRINRIKGQALALRANVHFDLLRYWADNMDRNSTSLGVPYIKLSVLETSPAAQRPTRNTVKECYDEIYADLNNARTMLSDVDRAINTATDRTRLDLVGVNAIHARVALYAKDWATAITHSTAVINARPLAARTVYPLIWRDNSWDEVIYACLFSDAETPNNRFSGDVFSGATNRSQFEGNSTLFNTVPSADVRLGTSVNPGFGTLASPTRTAARLVIWKYLGKGAVQNSVCNFKAFRTGEMYLIRAEAYQANSQEALALADLNTLRTARITGFVNGTETGTALRDAIARERRVELFAEGHRWFDIKRATRGISRTNFAPPATAQNLAGNSFRWVWPIPQGEIDANPNIASQQNPGYN